MEQKEYNLSELCAPKLEYQYLSYLTDDPQYVNRVNKTRKLLSQLNKPEGLYMERINIDTGTWESETCTMFYDGKQFYIDLIKSSIQSNGEDTESLQLYIEALDAIDHNGMFATSENGSVYVRDYNRIRDHEWTEDEGAYLGAMLSLGAEAMKTAKLNNQDTVNLKRIERHWFLAKSITETYQKITKRTKTDLLTQSVDMRYENESNDKFIQCIGFCLGSDLAESFFILWRLTHEPKYREYAWQMAQALHKHCRVAESGGYTNIAIDRKGIEPVEQLDLQAVTFLRATLKYLYLIFCDDQYYPLDKWVFSTGGHPLPIRGTNEAFLERKNK